MPKFITKEINMVVLEDDIFIEDENCFTKLKVYKNDGDIWFKALTHTGLQDFYLTKKMAKELSEKLQELTND